MEKEATQPNDIVSDCANIAKSGPTTPKTKVTKTNELPKIKEEDINS